MATKNKNKKRIYTLGGYKSKYDTGGLPKWLYSARGKAMKKKMQGGGMYADNTVASMGQGNVGSTSNIVYQESDPKLQEERIRAAEEEYKLLAQEGKQAATDIKQMEEQGTLFA